MKIPPDEKVIVDYLFAEYPVLEGFRSAERPERFNLKKEEQILKLIDTEENKKKYYEWIELRDKRKGKVKKVKVKKNKVVKEKEKISDSNQVKRMKNQRDNMEKKLKKSYEEIVDLKAELEDIKLINAGLLKDQQVACHARNKAENFAEGSGWKKSKIEEFNTYKERCKKCVCGEND